MDWQKAQNPTKTWGLLYDENYDLGLGFLDRSAQQAAIEKSKTNRRKILLRSALAVFLVVVTSLSAWALIQTNIATEKSLEAQANSIAAISEKERAETQKERAESEKERAESEKQKALEATEEAEGARILAEEQVIIACLLYTSPSPRDRTRSRMPSSA